MNEADLRLMNHNTIKVESYTDKELCNEVIAYMWSDMDQRSYKAALIEQMIDRLLGR